MVLSRSLLAVPLIAALALSASPARADPDDWDVASDVVRNALVVAAIGVPVVKGDWDGAAQAGGSLVVTGAVTWALKETIHEVRPDGSDAKSFPSGHTSISFASAATLHNRYGWEVGIPAQFAAAFVGLARVKADKHFVHDVLVGAAIGEAAGLLITSKQDSSVQILPWGDSHGSGVAVAARF